VPLDRDAKLVLECPQPFVSGDHEDLGGRHLQDALEIPLDARFER
jgi:hypothetical protein